MYKLENAISNDILTGLIDSTITGIENKDCFYNQLHYVNRAFVETHFNELADVVVAGLAKVHPGITRNDIAYVNDFVAPVNLENSAVRPVTVVNQENKYAWHIDSIDQWMGPCYNLWIPVYRQQALPSLDDRALFEVITTDDMPELYDDNRFPKTDHLTDGASQHPMHLSVVQDFTGVDVPQLKNSMIYHDAKGKVHTFLKNQIKTTAVVKPEMGDAWIFQASQLHSSGPSQFERIGLAMKFIVTNPELGFKEQTEFRYPAPLDGWEGLFAGCYAQYKDFTSYKKYLDLCIQGEQVELRSNQDKLDNIVSVLREIKAELALGANQESLASLIEPLEQSSQEDDLEVGFL